MCGRYTITINAETARETFGLTQMPADFGPRYNVAPTQQIAVVPNNALGSAEWMRWGLIPFWAKDMSIGSRMINARSETLLEKPAFKNAFRKRRCLILADGFYEWKRGAGEKGRSQPYFFRRADGAPFAFAGLWEFWRSPEGEEIRSCTICTTEANEVVRPVHDRMPVMLSGDALATWLGESTEGELMRILRPYPGELMAAHAVSTAVNRPDVDVPDLILPIAA